MLVAILVVSILTLVLFGAFFVMIAIGANADNSKKKEIAKLNGIIETHKIRFDMLNETFAEYRDQFPIKTKYRVGAFVYLVENKRVYHGLVIGIHQGKERDITYTVQYAENGKSVNKIVDREQNKVYHTLAEAIEAEKLVTL